MPYHFRNVPDQWPRQHSRYFSLLVFLLLVLQLQAQQTYIVTKVADTTTGGCVAGDCSLRSAILAANADGQASIIKFDFAVGSPPYTILVRGTPLPPITANNTIIDGMLDNGYQMGDVIIDGRLLAGTVNGLDIMGTATEIYGLQIQNFSGNGIQAAATFAAITIAIGTVGKGNILVSNGGSGFFCPAQINGILDGNYIGTNPAFDTGLGNGSRGVTYNSFATEAPPIFHVTNCVIGNNAVGGITIDGRSVFNISDNIIGTDASATDNLDTGSSGISISGSVGGVIANNIVGFSGRGINVPASIPTQITQNSIFCNPNGGLVRTGNSIQVAITAATPTQISGTSNANGSTIEVFLQDLTGCPAGVPCQGKTFVGSTTVSGGNWTLDVDGLVSIGDVVTATATQSSGTVLNTSTFATCQTISCPTISANIESTPSCVAANSGSLTADPSGGAGPYNFSWSTGATTATISNLPPGTFTVTIVDADGCRALASGTVNEIESPVANAGPDVEICPGENTTLTATATGGTGPYNFSWNPGGNGASITVTPTATTVYDLTASDQNGCTDEDQVIVRITGPQQPDAGPDQTLCSGETASLQGTIAGGPSAGAPVMWTASVPGGTFSPSATVLNPTYTPPAVATTVTLTLSTTNGNATCPDLSDAMVITYVAAPTVDAGPDQTVCVGSPINLQGTIGDGASAGWSASVTGGSFSPDNLDPNAVYTPPVGIATVVLVLAAVDPAGICPTVRDQMTITFTTGNATADAGPDQVICAGETLSLAGTIGGSAGGGQWSTDGDGTFTNANALATIYTPGPNDLTNEGATLTLTTTGTGTCPPASDVLDFRIQAIPTYGVNGTDPSTCGDPDGNFMISGLNPGEAYEVSYVFAGTVLEVSQNASPSGTITIDNLGDGTYSEITVTDDFGCSGAPVNVVLSSPDGPALSANADLICIGGTGSVLGNATGGAGPYNHSWTDQGSGSAGGYTLADINTASLVIDASAAQAGTIDLLYQVTDNVGCSAALSVTVSITALPEISGVQLDSASAAAVADGSIQFVVNNGQAPYSYTWSGPGSGSATLAAAGTATIGNLLPGQYSLQLQDANGCTTSLRFRIGITPGGGGNCTTDAGSLQAAPSGGFQVCSSATARVVHNGDGTLDANDVLVFVLKAANGAVLKVNSIPEFTFDPNTMTLNTTYSAAARAGNPGPAGNVDPADPCLDESNAVEIVFRESLTGVLNFLQGEEELCQGEELILSTNDLGPVDYFWITPARDTLRTNESMVVLPNIQPEDNGEYYVIARNGDCLNDRTGPFNLVVMGLPAGTPICAGDDQTACERTASLQACDPGPGSGFWTSLSAAKITNSGTAATTVTDLLPGDNLFVWTVTVPGCGSVGSDTVRVRYESALFAQPDNFVLERANTEIFMDVLKNDNIGDNADYELTAITEPAFGVLQTLDHGFRFYENEMRRGTVEFVYQVCYFGGTCAGTCDTATVSIEVLNLPYLPEGITPDGDGRNDELTVLGFTPGDSDLRLELTIANQWGEIVFHSNDYTTSDPWKGTFGGKPVPQGAYYCHMKTILPEGAFVRTQTVYVVR